MSSNMSSALYETLCLHVYYFLPQLQFCCSSNINKSPPYWTLNQILLTILFTPRSSEGDLAAPLKACVQRLSTLQQSPLNNCFRAQIVMDGLGG